MSEYDDAWPYEMRSKLEREVEKEKAKNEGRILADAGQAAAGEHEPLDLKAEVELRKKLGAQLAVSNEYLNKANQDLTAANGVLARDVRQYDRLLGRAASVMREIQELAQELAKYYPRDGDEA